MDLNSSQPPPMFELNVYLRGLATIKSVMVIMKETAYPRLKSCPTSTELEKLCSSTPSEISWAKQKAHNPFSQLGLLTMLKTFQ